jgi:hypothetical protein
LWTHSEHDILPKPYDGSWDFYVGPGSGSCVFGFAYLVVNRANRRIYLGLTGRGLHARMSDCRSQSECVDRGLSDARKASFCRTSVEVFHER